MKCILYAAPAVLLLSLCLGCNNSGKYADQRALVKQENKQSNDPASADTARSMSTGLVGNANEQTQYLGDANKQKGGQKPAAPPAANPDWEKKIIKTADLSVETKNFGAFARRLHDAVKRSGGYVAQEEQSQSTNEITNSVSIKVPVAGFEDLLQQLPADSDRLVDKKISTQDVTMEVVDTKSRLETKKEVRERYIELLRQAHKMDDILGVQREIDEIQEQMDQASGRIAFLGHSAAYSTINLKFYQILVPTAPVDESPSFYHRLTDALSDGWKGLSDLLIGLLHGWPLLIGLGVVGFWVRKALRSVKTQPKQEATQ